MDPLYLNLVIVTTLAFVLSFIFALGGVGAAVALVPVLHWYGLPLSVAKTTGLLTNTLSMTGASVDNIRKKRLDFHLGIPIIISSFVLAPVGAWSSHFIPKPVILAIFTLFLLFSGVMLIFFRANKFEDQFRDDCPILGPAVIGIIAGYVSGLLGVGGGGLIAPLMIMLGFNPKKVAVITAFVVPFSSLSGLITYMAMGAINYLLLIAAAIAAYLGGSLGTKVMHAKLSPGTVKKFLGGLLLILALKMGLQLLN